MAEVTLHLPAILEASVGTARVHLSAGTLSEALERAYEELPALRFHLCEDSGRFRAHVLCFHNDRNTRDMDSLDAPLRDGDRIRIVQAISGG